MSAKYRLSPKPVKVSIHAARAIPERFNQVQIGNRLFKQLQQPDAAFVSVPSKKLKPKPAGGWNCSPAVAADRESHLWLKLPILPLLTAGPALALIIGKLLKLGWLWRLLHRRRSRSANSR